MFIESPTYAVVYSALHQECGHTTRIADWRIRLEEDLPLVAKTTDSYNPLLLHCAVCNAELSATHLEIVEFDGPTGKKIVPRTEIEVYLGHDGRRPVITPPLSTMFHQMK